MIDKKSLLRLSSYVPLGRAVAITVAVFAPFGFVAVALYLAMRRRGSDPGSLPSEKQTSTGRENDNGHSSTPGL